MHAHLAEHVENRNHNDSASKPCDSPKNSRNKGAESAKEVFLTFEGCWFLFASMHLSGEPELGRKEKEDGCKNKFECFAIKEERNFLSDEGSQTDGEHHRNKYFFVGDAALLIEMVVRDEIIKEDSGQ